MKEVNSNMEITDLTKKQTSFLIVTIAIAIFLPLIYHHSKFKSITGFYDQLNQTSLEDYAPKVTQLVSGLTTLPQNETPRVYTIKDVTKVQNDRFFANAQNWDEVLVFNQAQKAIIYRPDTNEIINVAQ